MSGAARATNGALCGPLANRLGGLGVGAVAGLLIAGGAVPAEGAQCESSTFRTVRQSRAEKLQELASQSRLLVVFGTTVEAFHIA